MEQSTLNDFDEGVRSLVDDALSTNTGTYKY